MEKTAILWKTEGDAVRCGVCAHRCRVAEGRRGICGVRENRGGTLYALNYGKLVSANLDPIEKKPLYHFLPGSLSYSIATVGCNFKCAHCQNYEISQGAGEFASIPGVYTEPSMVVADAARRGAASISYTYTEPTIFIEYARDVMAAARGAGLKNVFVSNGYMTGETINEVAGLLDAINVDLKGFRDEFYRKICGARLEPVKESIKALWELGVWVEVTTLIIPGHNDGEEELRALAGWLSSVSPDVVWHVSGFRPTFKLTDAPPTSSQTLAKARGWGLEAGLNYVYTGNRPVNGGEDTVCPGCGAVLISRHGFSVEANRMGPGGQCLECGRKIAGIY